MIRKNGIETGKEMNEEKWNRNRKRDE